MTRCGADLAPRLACRQDARGVVSHDDTIQLMIFVQPHFMAHDANPMSLERREMSLFSNKSMDIMRLAYGHKTALVNEYDLFESESKVIDRY